MRLATPFAVVALSLFATAARGDAFEEFRIPDHDSHEYSFGFSGSGNTGNAWGDLDNHGSSLSGVFNGGAQWRHDRDARQWFLLTTLATNGARSHGDEIRLRPDGNGWSKGRGRSLTEMARLSASLREYPEPLPFALTLSFDATAQDGQAWSYRDDSTYYAPGPFYYGYGSRQVVRDARWSYARDLSGRAGLGWGRVRDASPVFLAWRLEERWLRDGVLSRPLSREARERLAQLLSIRGDFGFAHDRPEKAFWGDVEHLLEQDGALAPGGLSAYAALHGLEPIVHSAASVERLSGFFVGPFVQFHHGHVYERRMSSGHNYYAQADTFVFAGSYGYTREFGRYSHDTGVGISAEYHRSFGVRTQCDAACQVFADTPKPSRNYYATSELRARYWLGERWAAGVSASHQRTLGGWNQWSASLGGSLDYYLEDHWSAGADASAQRTVDYVPSGSGRRSANFHVGLGWNRGALNAPGLIEPVRPLD